FDNDNNGSVDGVYLIYAGYGEEAGGGSNAIWAHAWSIPTVYKDGKKVNRYSCSAELKGNSGSKITAIGVICHEFGHVLGAPDYYDTDYSTGGSFSGTGRWDMMAGGSWNNGGVTPAQHNAFTKVVIYGWANATVLSSAKNVTVKNSVDNKSFYRINSKTNNEYWIMENRQKTGFDAKIPGHGLMIYHVHKNVHNVGNKINATSPQKMYPVCASASTNPGSSKSSYGSINSGGCPFPGTSNKTSLTDATTPHMKSWAGQNTNAPITNIKETNGVITFKFKGGGSGDTQAPTKPSNLKSSNVTSSSLSLSWNASSDNVGVKSYSVYQNNKKVKSVSGTSTSISGLTASTSYSYYVKAADAAGNISGASNTINVTTKPSQPTYCASQGSNSSYEWISKVVIGDFSNSSNAAGYSNFTGKTITATAGKVLNVALTPGFSNQVYNEYWKIWIDYNNDKDFDDAGELAFDAGTMSSSAVTGFINIPSNADGATRLRVSMKYDGSQTACEAFKYGEVEDYTIIFESKDTIPPSRPNGLALQDVTTTSVQITWKPSTDNVEVIGYKLYVNGVYHGETNKLTYNFDKLTPGTEYNLKVAAFDEAGNISGKSKKLVAKTLDVVLNYCSSKGNNVYYEWIDYVEMAGIKNTTAANNGYADFTGKVATVAPGSSVKIYMSAGFRSTKYTEFWSVWIDWNKNGSFDADELMVHGSTSSSDLFSGTVQVPSTATGSTRMRVTMKYRAAATPCETFNYGEVEDYTVVVSSGARVPGMSLASVSPLGNEDRVYDVTINPNPVSGNTLLLECADTRATQYSIYNIYGAKVVDGQLNAQRNELDIANLAQGVYILKVNDGQKEIIE
ncbi:MAG: M6 family metalloprotease domain-containing protein, partial [Bacteroidales bacterium]|nr:M6 family metalloprotease domain-containing protein [Bacteroidales bacterium]